MRRFLEDHPVVYYAALVLALLAVGLLLTGDPFGALLHAAGESLRPLGETR